MNTGGASAGVVAAIVFCLSLPSRAGERGLQFPPGRLMTASGKLASADAFYEAESCASCHDAQGREWKGSLHNRAHQDSIYKAFADLARTEGGASLYVFCSSCHAPLAVVTGEIPNRTEGRHTFLTNEGVTCDACHSAQGLAGGPAGVGANGSLVLNASAVRYGPLPNPATNDAHASVVSPFHARAEFCSACHTLTHPQNGLVIENTYAEWLQGPYAKAGLQCQDCHMRTVDQAQQVAVTMKPFTQSGRACDDGPQRPDIHAHLFIGANVNQALNGSDPLHAGEALKRLQSAARIKVHLPSVVKFGAPVRIQVDVRNIGAGHSIPSSITELRQVWIDLKITDRLGVEVFRSGAVRDDGSVDPGAVMFHTVLADEKGQVTYKPWRATKMLAEKLIPPQTTVSETYKVNLSISARGPLTVRATLCYRAAPQEVLNQLFGPGKFALRVIEMTTTEAVLRID